MSTIEEVQERREPDPLQLIDEFKQAHQEMLRDALTTYAQPSNEMIVTTGQRMEICNDHMQLFKDRLYFKDSDNPLLMSLTLSSVIEASNELVKRILALDPDHEEIATFKDGIQPWLEFCISKDESIELSDEMKDHIETGNVPTPEQTAQTASNVYSGLLQEFEIALINSDNVREYIFEQNRKLSERAERITSLKLYGGALIAAFAGSFMANYVQKRK
jgi:hypothetical protein